MNARWVGVVKVLSGCHHPPSARSGSKGGEYSRSACTDSEEISEFLLVPYFGACIHAPPPPPNQTIFVRTDDPILLKDLPQAVWIEGTLHAQKQESDLADAAYIIDLSRVEKYEY